MIDFLLAHGSYLGIIVFMILTGAGLPLPEEVAIVAAGVLSSLGQLDPWLALACCLIGALAGDCVMYWIGHHFGHRVLREHHWWNRFVKPEREAQMEQMLQDHGFKVLFLARFLVGLRSPVYLSAGILRLPFKRFILIDLFCATTVISTFFGLSYFFGEPIFRWIRAADYAVTAIVIVAVAATGIYLWRRRVRRVAEQSAASSQRPAENRGESIDSAGESNDGEAGWTDAAECAAGTVPDAEADTALSEGTTVQRTP